VGKANVEKWTECRFALIQATILLPVQVQSACAVPCWAEPEPSSVKKTKKFPANRAGSAVSRRVAVGSTRGPLVRDKASASESVRASSCRVPLFSSRRKQRIRSGLLWAEHHQLGRKPFASASLPPRVREFVIKQGFSNWSRQRSRGRRYLCVRGSNTNVLRMWNCDRWSN
jgi:hypothetical protein